MSRVRRSCAVALLVLLCLTPLSGLRAESEPSQARAEFEKSAWPIKNFFSSPEDFLASGATLLPTRAAWRILRAGGACGGMNMLAIANYLQRKQDPNAPDLLRVASRLGWADARALAARAHSIYADHFARSVQMQVPSPDKTIENVINAVRTTGNPQVLEVWNSKHQGHQITILGTPAIRDGDYLRFEAYDVNAYSEVKAKHFPAYFRYNTKDKSFSLEWDLGDGPKDAYEEYHFNTIYHQPLSPTLPVIKELQELINDAADGSFDQASGSTGKPGGVALTTRIKVPDKSTLKHVGVTDDGKVYATIGDRDLQVVLKPEVLAVLLQGVVLAHQSPLLSIGSEASDVNGQMKVTYSGLIKDTPVGRALLDADLKLKGLMIGTGLGPGGTPAPRIQDFLSTFPPLPSASALRLWIVGTEVALGIRDDHLVEESHGLRLRYELESRGRTVDDPELERFVTDFNRRWAEVADAVPEFKRLEEMAFAMALAVWVRDARCTVDPELIGYPFELLNTPDYVPALCAVTATGLPRGEGGIGLSGDLPSLNLGTLLGIGLGYLILGSPQTRSGVWAWLIALGIAALGFSPVFLLRLLIPDEGALSPADRWRRALRLWGLILGSMAVIYLVCSEVLFALLGDFDAEFAAVILLVAAPIYLVHLILTRSIGPLSARWTRFGCPALGAFAFVALSMISIATEGAVLTVSGKLSPSVAVTCRLLSAPLSVLARPICGTTAFSNLIPQASSLTRSTLWRFEASKLDRVDLREDQLRTTSLFGETGPPGQSVLYNRIPRGQRGMVSRETVFTTDPERKLPY